MHIRIEHNHYHHNLPDPAIPRELAKLNRNLEKFMSDIDDFVTLMNNRITAQTKQVDGIAALLSSIKHQLADALVGEKLSPMAQAKLAAIMPALEANTTEITDAINANTDAAPPVTPPAPPEPTPRPDPFSPAPDPFAPGDSRPALFPSPTPSPQPTPGFPPQQPPDTPPASIDRGTDGKPF